MSSVVRNILSTVLLVSGALLTLCCSNTADNRQTKTTGSGSQVSNSSQMASSANANANAHHYALDDGLPPTSKAIDVPANVVWVDSGVDLQEGQKFMVVASGEWSVGNYGSGAIGTLRECRDCIVSEGNLAELVAKIGEESFVIGDKMQMSAPSDGRLYLGINDVPNQFHDNRGKVSAIITYGSVSR